MSRIANAFLNKKAFIAFLTGGDPSLEQTLEYIEALIEGGADLIEIGVPFSDPIAEGPVIQAANIRAMKNEINLDKLFDLVLKVREKSQIPLVFLTYLNPVFRYGYADFFEKAAKVGLDGVIIPDLPFEEQGELRSLAKESAVDLISLIAPTSEERVAAICAEAMGFIYVVSSMGVTGVRTQVSAHLHDLCNQIHAQTDLPLAVGFGIHLPEQAREMKGFADGVIVGSAIVQMIGENPSNAAQKLKAYSKEMKRALS